MIVALRVFVPFALGYFLSYVFRVVNAVIAPDLVADLALDAGALGLLTSTYFLTFAAFQLPLGILLDRFGPRRTEAALLLVAAAGAFVFAAAPNAGTLVVGRGLIGVGVSACLMAAFKAFVQWFPAGRLPLINGLEMAVGGIGALAATVPVEAALTVTDWRGVFWGLGALTVAAAVLVYLMVPEKDDGPAPHGTFRQLVGGVVQVMTSPVFWRVAPATFTTQASFLAVQSLWAGPWLRDVAGYDRAGVANGLLVIALAMMAGFIFAGGIAERLGRLGIKPVAVAMVAMNTSIALQAGLVFGLPVPPLLIWSAFALFGTSGILVYAGLSQTFPKHLAGRVNTSINLLVFVASFLFQWGVGVVIGLWPATAGGGYDPAAYRAGFGAVLAVQVAAMLWLVLFRKAPLPLKG
ncbi:MFS transporter [Shumkonia mesophila]|uniref:MFS transporter n=1 Tax=Shumkonia mesophila TaxID=2838854 RepID=UPI0029344F74|nr:MFS transporter [Shumkonia mesophila]